jgi:hypothetical protein
VKRSGAYWPGYRQWSPPVPGRIWWQTLDNQVTEQSLEAVMQWMLDGGRFFVRGRIGRNAQEVEGILLRHDALEASVARSFTRCGVCARIEANGAPNSGCARPRCSGAMLPYAGPVAEGNLNARLIAESYAPTLLPGEHSAAVTEEERLKAEEGFKQSPPRPNVLPAVPVVKPGPASSPASLAARRTMGISSITPMK